MNLFIRKNLYLGILLILVFDIVVIYYLVSLSNSEQIYLRNILFSQIVSDSEVLSEAKLNSIIASEFKTEDDMNDFDPFLNAQTTKKLLQLKNTSKDPDRDLVIAIVGYLGVNPSGLICGVHSLGKVIIDVERGIGCCSDYTKALIFYANYLGLQVREVNTLGHNTVEYFDHRLNQWSWIDPYNRVEILGRNNQPVNQFQMRKESLFLALKASKLSSSPPSFEVENYIGYAPAELSVLMWRKGTNFLTVEKWDARMRNWHIPKSIRQMILLSTGIAPHWVMLATDAIAVYMRSLQALLYWVASILLLINTYLIFALIYVFLGSDRRDNYPSRAGN